MARKQYVDPDLELDQTRWLESPQGPSESLADPEGTWSLPEPPPRRVRRSSARPTAGVSSAHALANYFTVSCPPMSWSGGLEIGNYSMLVGIFADLKRSGLTADQCRALTDFYFRSLDGRRVRVPYIRDFRHNAFTLWARMRDAGLTTTAADYQDLLTPYQTPQAEQDAYAASWENV